MFDNTNHNIKLWNFSWISEHSDCLPAFTFLLWSWPMLENQKCFAILPLACFLFPIFFSLRLLCFLSSFSVTLICLLHFLQFFHVFLWFLSSHHIHLSLLKLVCGKDMNGVGVSTKHGNSVAWYKIELPPVYLYKWPRRLVSGCQHLNQYLSCHILKFCGFLLFLYAIVSLEVILW